MYPSHILSTSAGYRGGVEGLRGILGVQTIAHMGGSMQSGCSAHMSSIQFGDTMVPNIE